MEALNTGERVPLVLADPERFERLKARLEETARQAAATEQRIRKAADEFALSEPIVAPERVRVISATTAPGFSLRSAPLLAARRLSRR